MSDNIVEFQPPRDREHRKDAERTREILKMLADLAGDLDGRAGALHAAASSNTGYVDDWMLHELAERVAFAAGKARSIIEYAEEMDIEN